MRDETSATVSAASGQGAAAVAGPQAAAGWPDRVEQALAEDRIALALQPVVMAAAPDRPAFHEGLIRLIERDGTIVAAGTFIEAVEPTPTGRALDRAALRLALGALTETPDLRLAVNLSPLGFGDCEWGSILAEAVQANPTLAERLIIEVTERAHAVDRALMRAFMDHWRAQGIAFALDDFGAGSTGCRHLSDFRFDIVKIDGSFSRAVHSDPDNQAFLRFLIPLARHFEALTVAEAVECAAEARFLAGLGVDALQGFHFGAPRIGRAVGSAAAALIA